jgi:hypothetical protein
MAESDFDAPIRGTVPLAAIQVIKLWLQDGAYQERVYDVAGEVSNTHTVDPQTCAPTAPANAPTELCAVWSDPDFDPAEHPLYYVRVLEHSTCRWSTLVCVAQDYDCDNPTRPIDEACCSPSFGLNRAQCDTAQPDCSDPDALDEGLRECCELPVDPYVRQRAWTSPISYQAPAD